MPSVMPLCAWRAKVMAGVKQPLGSHEGKAKCLVTSSLQSSLLEPESTPRASEPKSAFAQALWVRRAHRGVWEACLVPHKTSCLLSC